VLRPRPPRLIVLEDIDGIFGGLGVEFLLPEAQSGVSLDLACRSQHCLAFSGTGALCKEFAVLPALRQN
jgi:hypothetical protein